MAAGGRNPLTTDRRRARTKFDGVKVVADAVYKADGAACVTDRLPHDEDVVWAGLRAGLNARVLLVLVLLLGIVDGEEQHDSEHGRGHHGQQLSVEAKDVCVLYVRALDTHAPDELQARVVEVGSRTVREVHNMGR